MEKKTNIFFVRAFFVLATTFMLCGQTKAVSLFERAKSRAKQGWGWTKGQADKAKSNVKGTWSWLAGSKKKEDEIKDDWVVVDAEDISQEESAEDEGDFVLVEEEETAPVVPPAAQQESPEDEDEFDVVEEEEEEGAQAEASEAVPAAPPAAAPAQPIVAVSEEVQEEASEAVPAAPPAAALAQPTVAVSEEVQDAPVAPPLPAAAVAAALKPQQKGGSVDPHEALFSKIRGGVELKETSIDHDSPEAKEKKKLDPLLLEIQQARAGKERQKEHVVEGMGKVDDTAETLAQQEKEQPEASKATIQFDEAGNPIAPSLASLGLGKKKYVRKASVPTKKTEIKRVGSDALTSEFKERLKGGHLGLRKVDAEQVKAEKAKAEEQTVTGKLAAVLAQRRGVIESDDDDDDDDDD